MTGWQTCTVTQVGKHADQTVIDVMEQSNQAGLPPILISSPFQDVFD